MRAWLNGELLADPTAGAVAVTDHGFTVGDGVSPATLELNGGLYHFGGGLIISSNATVTGCGTIVGTISNSGTLATNCTAAPSVVITNITKIGNDVVLYFTTLAGQLHVAEYKNSLNDPTWTPIPPGVTGTGAVMTQTDANATVPTRYYRIRVGGTAAASPVIVSVTKSETTVTLQFTTTSGVNHFIQYADAPNATSWTSILPAILGNGSVMSGSDTNATAIVRFYRILAQ